MSLNALVKNLTLYMALLLTACSNNGELYTYVVAKTAQSEKEISDWRPVMRVVYRVGDTSVITEVAGLLDEYQNCLIKNEVNWECSYEDGTGLNQFGFKDGKYWQNPRWGGDVKHISRWRFNLIRCKWYQHDKGYLNGTLTCLKTYV